MIFWRGLDLRFDNLAYGRNPAKALVVDRLESAMVKFPFWGVDHGVCPSVGFFRTAGTARTGWILRLLQRVMVFVYGRREQSNSGYYRRRLSKAWKAAARRLTKNIRRWARQRHARSWLVTPVVVYRIKKRFKKMVRRGWRGSWVDCLRFWRKQLRKRLMRDALLHRKVRWCMHWSAVFGGGTVPVHPGRLARRRRFRLDVCCLNIGTMSHVRELVAGGDSPTVFALQETRVSGRSMRSLIPKGYVFFDNPRTGGGGGGTGFLVRKDVIAEPLRSLWKVSQPLARGGGTGEWQWMRIQADQGGGIYFCNLYSPPNTAYNRIFSSLIVQIRTILGRRDCTGVYVCGDFNCPLVSDDVLRGARASSGGDSALGRRSFWLRQFASVGHAYEILNLRAPRATHHQRRGGRGSVSTIIDYCVWFGRGDAIRSFLYSPGPSDHNSLTSTFDLRVLSAPFVPVINFNRLKYGDEVLATTQEFSRAVATEMELIDDQPSMEMWIGALERGARSALGMTKPPPVRLSFHSEPWWTPDLSALQRTVRRCCHRLDRFRRRRRNARPGPRSLRSVQREGELVVLVKEARRHFRYALLRTRDKFFSKMKQSWVYTESLHVREAFKLVQRTRTGVKKPVVHSQEVMEEAWRPIFGASPPRDSTNSACAAFVRRWMVSHGSEPLPIADRILPSEVAVAVSALPLGKACGKDGIPNEALKALPECAVVQLAHAMSHLLDDPSRRMPDQWLVSLVCLLPKTDNPLPTQYRPITLLSCLAKLLEKVLDLRVRGLGLPIHQSQAGFQKGRGCMEQVWRLALVDQVMRATNREGLAILLDIRKAYDRVPHDILIAKLIRRGDLPPYFIRFIHVWVRNHRRQLLAGGSRMSELPVACGLPQGSVLSCRLFNLFFDDFVTRQSEELEGVTFPLRLRDSDWQWRTATFGFADDSAQVVCSVEDAQRSMSICQQWQISNGMAFVEAKTVQVRLGKKRRGEYVIDTSSVRLNDSVVTESASASYLGVRIGGARTPKISTMVARNEVLEWVDNHSFTTDPRGGCPVAMGAMVARALFEPKFYYGAEVFGLDDIAAVRKVMGKLGKRCLSTYDSVSTTSCFEYLGWMEPVDRVYRSVLCFALRMGASPFEEYRNLVNAVCGLELPWSVRLQEAISHGVEREWFEDGDVFVGWLGNRAQCTAQLKVARAFGKITPHPFFKYGGVCSHHSFIFWYGEFNPRGSQEDTKCLLCDEEDSEDRPGHLVHCEDPRVFAVCADFAVAYEAATGEFLTVNEARLHLGMEHPTPPQAVEAAALAHRKLWKVRTRIWKQVHRGALVPVGE